MMLAIPIGISWDSLDPGVCTRLPLENPNIIKKFFDDKKSSKILKVLIIIFKKFFT
jgi:hypothetical protein